MFVLSFTTRTFIWPGSSLVERCPEEAGVGSSILPWATIRLLGVGESQLAEVQLRRDGSIQKRLQVFQRCPRKMHGVNFHVQFLHHRDDLTECLL